MDQRLEPRLRVGTLCERTLEEKDGVLSLIRLIDRLVITAEGVEVPKDLPPGQVAVMVVMSWVNGLGDYEAKIRVDMPDGGSIESMTLPFHLDSFDKVQNHVVRMLIPVRRAGLYWFRFLLGDEVRGEVPLRVIYQRKLHPKKGTSPRGD
jgi:hypothetical protein